MKLPVISGLYVIRRLKRAGFTGKLCIIGVNTKDYWLSKTQKRAGM